MRLLHLSSLLIATFLWSCVEFDAEIEDQYGMSEQALTCDSAATFLASTSGRIWKFGRDATNGYSHLYSIDPYNGGNYIYHSGKQGCVEAMTAIGSYIYAIIDHTLYRANVAIGSAMVPFSAFPSGWTATKLMSAYGSYLYAVDANILWRVNLITGAVEPQGAYYDGWQGTEAMVAHSGYLFGVQGGYLWREVLSSGYVDTFGDTPGPTWNGTEAMSAYGNYLYVVQGGTLWREDLSDGHVRSWGQYANSWSGTQSMTSYGGYLYAFQGGSVWREDLSNGSVIFFH